MKRFFIFCSALVACIALAATWYVQEILPQRSGDLHLT